MLAILFGIAPLAAAETLIQPFYSRNLNPFVQIYGLPAAENATITPEGSLDARLVLDIANNFTNAAAEAETIAIRGETYRTVLALRYGHKKDLELGIDLPSISHSRGHLNNFISDWHDTFGLPQGDRDTAPDNRLTYQYGEGGNTLVGVNDSASGLGDILFSAAVPLWEESEKKQRALALRAAVKAPTGSTSKLLGSGSTDVSLRLTGEDHQTFARAKIACFGSMGAMLMSEGDILPHRQRHAAGFGSVGFGWQPFSWLALKLQLDGHTAFYDSDLPQLGKFSTQLIMGGTVKFPGNFLLDLGVSEDIIVDTAPDVTFHLALRRRF